MRILADENVDRPIVNWLRKQGHDVAEVAAIMPGSSDPDLIEHSRGEDRVLITFDRDIGRLVLAHGKHHPGVIYLRLRGAGQEVWDRFGQLWPRLEPAVAGHLVTVRNDRIRRRPLPDG